MSSRWPLRTGWRTGGALMSSQSSWRELPTLTSLTSGSGASHTALLYFPTCLPPLLHTQHAAMWGFDGCAPAHFYKQNCMLGSFVFSDMYACVCCACACAACATTSSPFPLARTTPSTCSAAARPCQPVMCWMRRRTSSLQVRTNPHGSYQGGVVPHLCMPGFRGIWVVHSGCVWV